MSMCNVDQLDGGRARRHGDLVLGILSVLWQLIRLPIFTLLVILEPIVRMLLTGLALLGTFIAIFIKCSGAAPHFSFWSTLATSVAFGLVLLAYEAAVRLFSR
jgi:hypothetical protein